MIARIFKKRFQKFLPEYVEYYLHQTDKDLTLPAVSRRTVAWITSWSEELGNLMQLNSHKELEKILIDGLKKGDGIEEFTRHILESGIRDERYKARRVAITEVLRAHSVAQQEAFMQSPSVTEKLWRHTGSYRNKPRENHVAMNGKRVPKGEPFQLLGRDGIVYSCMHPHDTVLPAAESVNCHCLCEPVVSKEVLGLSLEERQALQRQAIAEMDDEWERELDARNRARAGIDEERVGIHWIRQKSRKEQIKYFGGGSAGKQRLALLDSGVITTDSELERLYKHNSQGVRVKKTLQELADDGIFTVSDTTLKHAVEGEYINPSKSYPKGRLKNGGHSEKTMQIMKQKGIRYHVVKTYQNGVRIGYVEGHKRKEKNGLVNKSSPNADIGQSWFPKSWSDEDIRNAGTFVANKGSGSGAIKFANYKGVRIGIYVDEIGMPTTIFPHNMEQPLSNGGLEGARS